jgi:hypothetical protein
LGNFIGTDVSGTAPLGNFSDGVHLEGNVSQNEVAANTISGNGTGVEIFGTQATGNKVSSNFIGTGEDGTSSLGNSGFGVFINAQGNFVGGTVSGEGNTIAFNGQDGVVIAGSAATGNRFLRNSTFSNGELGIDLMGGTENAAGATQNDPDDTGPNNLQNKPVIDSAVTSSGETTIQGRLNSTPEKTFTIQFFSSPTGNEGKTFIRQRNISTNSEGNTGTFTVTLASPVAVGDRITATATGPGGNTSEFSAPRVVTAP